MSAKKIGSFLNLSYLPHIFQKVQVASNKMVHKQRNHLLVQFFMAFHVVSFFLLGVLASKTTLWMAGIFQQPIRCFCFMVFEANTHSKTEHTMWKGIENCARKWWLSLCTILFEVTWAFCKMCCSNLWWVNVLVLPWGQAHQDDSNKT